MQTSKLPKICCHYHHSVFICRMLTVIISYWNNEEYVKIYYLNLRIRCEFCAVLLNNFHKFVAPHHSSLRLIKSYPWASTNVAAKKPSYRPLFWEALGWGRGEVRDFRTMLSPAGTRGAVPTHQVMPSQQTSACYGNLHSCSGSAQCTPNKAEK